MPYYSKKILNRFLNPKFMGRIKNPDGIGRIGNPRCVASGTLVHTEKAIKKIENIKIGDRVIGHDGRFHKVTDIFIRKYSSDILKVRVHNLGEIVLTPDHPVLCLKARNELRKFKRYKNYTENWYTASDIEKGDIIVYPVLDKSKDINSILLRDYNVRASKGTKLLPKEVIVNKYFLKVMGYFLAEGSAITKSTKAMIDFAFSEKEEDFVEDISQLMKKVFNIFPSRIYSRKNCTRVDFYNTRLARFFKDLMGAGAANKKLPGWVSTLSKDKQAYILYGLWRGDGYLNSNRAMYVTISKVLAAQIKMILLRQGIIFSFVTEPAYGMHKESYRFFIQDRRSLAKLKKIIQKDIPIAKRPGKKNNSHSWFDNGYYYTTIYKISRQKYRGLVYNLEVAQTHSFLTDTMALHNCGDTMVIYLKIRDKKIAEIGFETLGCGAAIASSDMICELALGKTLAQAKKIKFSDVAKQLGEMPKQKLHCASLAEHALKAAIQDYERRANLL